MARSILPSTKRKTARQERAQVNRAGRRHSRQETRSLFREDDYVGNGANFCDDKFRHEIRYVVNERRQGDKLGPFMRWAEQVTKDLPRNERMRTIKSLLPDNLIGQHAMAHLERVKTLLDERQLHLLETEYGASKSPWWKKGQYPTFENVVEALREIIRRGFHGDFNKAMGLATSRWVPPKKDSPWQEDPPMIPFGKKSRPQKLLGLHDAESFWRYVVKNQHDINYQYRIGVSGGTKNPDFCPHIMKATCDFLREHLGITYDLPSKFGWGF